jgi:nicotinamidase-related amidase
MIESSLTEQSNVLALPGKHVMARKRFPILHRGTLVVVDMQPGFSDASRNPTTLYTVELLIKQAVEDRRAVVVLENDPRLNGRTYWLLLKHLAGYPLKAVVPKFDDDGSNEVIDACDSNGFDEDDFEFGGVHTDACVTSTVDGIARRRRRAHLNVFKEACNSNTPSGMWEAFTNEPNVSIVSVRDLPARFRKQMRTA